MKFATLVSSEPDFWPGLQTLAYSLRKYGKLKGDFEWILICIGEPDWDVMNYMRELNFWPVRMDIEAFDWRAPHMPHSANAVQLATNKLLYWLLPEDETYCCLDADLLCTNDATQLLTFEPFSASRGPRHMYFCSGLMIIRPDPDIFHEMVGVSKFGKWRGGDNMIIGYYYGWRRPEELHTLEWEWNFSVKEELRIEAMIWSVRSRTAKFLHYQGPKPWLEWPAPWEEYHERYYDAERVWHRINKEMKDDD